MASKISSLAKAVKFKCLWGVSDGDFRKDTVVKSAMLDKMLDAGYKPVMVFDDRPSVIDMWHDRGLKVMDVRDPSKGNF